MRWGARKYETNVRGYNTFRLGSLLAHPGPTHRFMLMEEDRGEGARGHFLKVKRILLVGGPSPLGEGELCCVDKALSTERNFNCFTLTSKARAEVSVPNEEKEVL